MRFHIVGGGRDLERLQMLREKRNKRYFLWKKTTKRNASFMRRQTLCLNTLQEDEVLSMTLPGKVQSYMAVGKPIIGAINGETKKVIEDAKCGYCGRAEDAEALAENIRTFCEKS